MNLDLGIGRGSGCWAVEEMRVYKGPVPAPSDSFKDKGLETRKSLSARLHRVHEDMGLVMYSQGSTTLYSNRFLYGSCIACDPKTRGLWISGPW